MYRAAQLQYIQLRCPVVAPSQVLVVCGREYGPAESVAGVLTRRRTASIATGAPVTRPEIVSLRVPDAVREGGPRSKTIDPGGESETVARPRECAESTHHTKYALVAL